MLKKPMGGHLSHIFFRVQKVEKDLWLFWGENVGSPRHMTHGWLESKPNGDDLGMALGLPQSF